MTAPSVVAFASGSPLSLAALDRLSLDCRLVGIVRPSPVRSLARRLRQFLGRGEPELERFGAPLIDAAAVERLRPDLIVVASFPSIIPKSTLAAAQVGAFNLHMSLLPRHRGPDPLFWTYWHDDAEAGVTIHWMSEGIDAGDIAARTRVRLERGLASRELYLRLVPLGVTLMADVVAAAMAGRAEREPQDEACATYESAAEIARATIPFAEWPAERVWHVLSGLGDQRHELVADPQGRRLSHGRASGLSYSGPLAPGRVEIEAAGLVLHCRDGIVTVERHR